MSLKKIEQVKADKGFKIFDLIIYGAVIALVAALFIAVFTTRNTDPLSGVRIYVSAEVVFEYEFGQPPVPTDKAEVVEDGQGITVTIRTDGGGVNVVYIDKSKKTVKMKEANCRGKQCKDFPAMENNSSVIICSSHGIKIEPYFKDLDSPNIIL